jgi:hypothetical protein
MARGILSEYGPNTPKKQAGPLECGGVLPGDEVDVMNYKPPQGPKNIMDPKTPGLHGSRFGNTNGPDRGGPHSGSPGLGGTNHGNGGSQGRY